MIRTSGIFLFISLVFISQAQRPAENWHHQDRESNGIYGISSERAFSELLKGKPSTPVVVAIIDSGTETFHPDLAASLWVNEDEVPGNFIDDDSNGYVDDVHGWSFIGGPGGDVKHDNLEFTRVYKGLLEKFGQRDPSSITSAEKSEYDRYVKMKGEYQERIKKSEDEKMQFDQVIQIYNQAKETFKIELKNENFTLEELKAYTPTNEYTAAFREFLIMAMEQDLEGEIEAGKEHFSNSLEYSYNLDFDPRWMVGDNYNDPRQRDYGNNHIDGPKAEHGTHVAGIVGATNNNFGVNGVCPNAKLMIIRCVPDGDERDKDVANSIRYAADNGARVINMSFGKSLSPFKEVVDEAVQYAESKGVLMIHAAGNDGKNIDKRDNFPTDKYLDGKKSTAWIEVGATGPDARDLIANFSNYGKKNVDVFAPGVDVYSTTTGNSYKYESGTSMAAPVVTGVAAALLSFYPNLTPQQLKKIILKSSYKPKKIRVFLPGDPEKKSTLKKLSVTGGIVNLYNAVKMAEKM